MRHDAGEVDKENVEARHQIRAQVRGSPIENRLGALSRAGRVRGNARRFCYRLIGRVSWICQHQGNQPTSRLASRADGLNRPDAARRIESRRYFSKSPLPESCEAHGFEDDDFPTIVGNLDDAFLLKLLENFAHGLLA